MCKFTYRSKRGGKRVRRAKKEKKSLADFLFGQKKEIPKSQNSDREVSYEINEEEDKDLQLKYFGKIIEEREIPKKEEIKEEETLFEKEQDEEEQVKIVSQEPKEEIIPKKEKKSKNKITRKHIAIFVVSLVAILVTSLVTLTMGGLFNNDGYIENIELVNEETGKVNVLLLGVDKEGLRTDTIVIASVDLDDNNVNLLSIPRDTRMYIGSRYQKINAAHALTKSNGKIKGAEGTIEAVTRLTGIPINYYIEFSFDAFRDTIDALGGVYFDVASNMYYNDPTQDLYINLKKGYQLLDGDKAEQLVRYRRYPEGDIKRVEVQQEFLKAVAEQKLNVETLTKLPNLYKSLSRNIKTNFTASDVLKYAGALKDISVDTIKMHSLPGRYSEGQFSASYWLCDLYETKVLVETVFGYDTSDTTTGKAKTDAVYGEPAVLGKEIERPYQPELVSEITPSNDDDEEDEQEPEQITTENEDEEEINEEEQPPKRPDTQQEPTNTPTPPVEEEPTPEPEPTPESEPTPEPEPEKKPQRPQSAEIQTNQENNGGFVRPPAN